MEQTIQIDKTMSCLSFHVKDNIQVRDTIKRYYDDKIGTLNNQSNIQIVKTILRFIFNSGTSNTFHVSNIDTYDYEPEKEKYSGFFEITPVIMSENKTNIIHDNEVPRIGARRKAHKLYVEWISLGKAVVISRSNNQISPFNKLIEATFEIDTNTTLSREDWSYLRSIPRRRRQLIKRSTEWEEYLEWREIQAKNSQFAARIVKFDFDLTDEKITILFELENSDERNKIRWNDNLVFVDNSLSLHEERWVEDEDKPFDDIRLGKFPRKGKIYPHTLSRNDRNNLDFTVKANIYRIELEMDEGLLKNLIQRQNQNIPFTSIIPKPGDFLMNSIGGDLSPLYAQLRALRRLRNQEVENYFLGDFVFDFQEARTPNKLQNQLVHKPLIDLNDPQMDGILKILNAPDIAFIQGPPGTGKTTIIAELCHQICKEGGRVLVSSQSNLAVDNALSRLMDVKEIMPIRLGKVRSVTEDGMDFIEENAVNRWFNSVEKNIKDRVTHENQIRSKIDSIETKLQEIERLLKKIPFTKDEIKEETEKYKNTQNRLEKINDTLDQLNQSKNEKIIKLRNIPSINDLSTWKTGLLDRSPIFHELLVTWKENLVNNLNEELLKSILYFYENQDDLSSALDFTKRAKKLINGEIVLPPELQEIRSQLVQQRQKLMVSTNEEDMNKLLEINKEINLIEKQGVELDWTELMDKLANSFPESLQTKYIHLLGSLNSDDNYLGDCNDLFSILRDISKAHSLLLETKPAIEQKISELNSEHQREIDTIDNKLSEVAEQKSTLLDKFKNIKNGLDTLKIKLQETRGTIETNKIHVSKIINENLEESDIDEIRSLVNQWKDNYKQDLSRMERWADLRGKWLTRVRNRKKKDINDLTDTYLNVANVVGATCYFSGTPSFYEDRSSFDYVVIDEVSKATPPELLMPILLGKKIVLIGDHRQLPPLFREGGGSYLEEDDEEAKETLKRFRKMVTTSYFEEGWEQADSSLKERLLLQYRMHSQIMEGVNQFYRDNPLQLGLPDLDDQRVHNVRMKNVVSPNNHLIWIDSSHQKIDDKLIRNYAEQFEGSTSRYNQFELEITEKILEAINSSHEEDQPLEIGLITFYGDQIKEMRHLISPNRDNWSNLDIRYGTVDRFQGAERPIIIVSLVGATKGGYVTKFVKDFRRINVAISRAQALLVIIAAEDDFAKARIDLTAAGGKENSNAYQRIIDVARNNGGFIDGWRLFE